MPGREVSTALGLVGAAVGGAIGYAGFAFAYRRGFYAMVLPGGLLGLGCGLLARHVSPARGAACAVAALALGLFTEWRFRPFLADDSPGYFLAHVHEVEPIGLVLIALGAALAFWCGRDSILGNWRGIGGKPAPRDPDSPR